MRIFLAPLFALSLLAQSSSIPAAATGGGGGTGDVTKAGTNTMTGYTDFSGGTMRAPEVLAVNLPSAASSTGMVYVVTDAVSSGSCTNSGGGTSQAVCRSNGSAWIALGGAALTPNLAVVRASATVLTVGNCSASAPCYTGFGDTNTSISAPPVVTLSGSISGTVYGYIDTGGFKVGYATGMGISCNASCTAVSGITQFPANVNQIFTCDAVVPVSAANWASSCNSLVALTRRELLAAGSNITLTQSGTTTTIASSGGTPDPTGHAGSYLVTNDGSTATWANQVEQLYSASFMYDDFYPSFSSSAVGYGQLRWATFSNSGGSTVTFDHTVEDPNHPGLLKIATGTASGNDVALHLMYAASTSFKGNVQNPNNHPGFIRDYGFRTDATITNLFQAVGLVPTGATVLINGTTKEGFQLVVSTAGFTCNAGSTSPVAGNFTYVSQDSAGNKWCYDTGVAIATNTFYKFRVLGESAGVVKMSFASGTSALGSVQTVPSNLPTATLGSTYHLKSTTAAATPPAMYVDLYGAWTKVAR